jgi:hypothetical protein
MRSPEIRLNRLYVTEELSFIVGRAAGVEVESFYRRSKGRSVPFRNGLSRQDIVMPIDDHRGTIRSTHPGGIDNRIAARWDYLDPLKADALQVPRQPVSALFCIEAPLRLRADAGKAQKFFQLRDEL